MDRINALRQQQIEAENAFKALLDEHLKAADGKRGFSAEELAAQKAAEDKLGGFEGLIAAETKRLELEKRRAAAGPSRIEVSAPNLENDPRRGFRSHRDFLLRVMENGGLRDRASVSDERLRAVAVFDKDDKQAGGELAYMLPVAFTPPTLLAAAGSDEQGEYSEQHGGFTVVTTRLPGLMSIGFEGDPTAGLTQSVPMQSPSVEILARNDKDHTTSVTGGFTVTRKPETVLATSSRMSLEKITLKATSLFGVAFETEELLADSPISFVAIIEAGFRDQFGAHMLNEKIRGKGGNEYLGILTALDAAGLGPTISIAKEAAQGKTIVAQNVIKMAAQCWGFGSAIWLANHNTRPQMYTLAIPVGVGGTLIYQPSREAGFPDMLLGRPVFYTEFASKLGDQGDIMLANWSQYLDGLYQPLQTAESVHVRFLNHERTFKSWLRNAGAPWWRVAMTPAMATEKLSPFVVLDAR